LDDIPVRFGSPPWQPSTQASAVVDVHAGEVFVVTPLPWQ